MHISLHSIDNLLTRPQTKRQLDGLLGGATGTGTNTSTGGASTAAAGGAGGLVSLLFAFPFR